MAPRVDLQAILEAIMGNDHVYFQPPTNVQMVYPSIVYKRDLAETEFADNKPYRYKKRYQVTVIDRDPDSGIPDKIAALPMCVFDRHYTADNLNHDVFTIFF
jgi:hypothetical protein